MTRGLGNGQQNDYTKRAIKKELKDWVKSYVDEVIDEYGLGDTGSGTGGASEDGIPVDDNPVGDNTLIGLKFYSEQTKSYIDPIDANQNLIPFGTLSKPDKQGNITVSVKARIEDDRETVDFWRIELNGTVVLEKENKNSKNIIFNNLAPGKDYLAIVRSFDKNKKGIGKSNIIKFRTNFANAGEKPSPVTNLNAIWDGRLLTAKWDYNNPPSDFSYFKVVVGNEDDSLVFPASTIDNFFKFTRTDLLSLFVTGIPSTIKITVYAVNKRSIMSDPTSTTVQESCLDAPTGAKLEAAVLGYIVSWDKIDSEAYQTTTIYESDSENGEYTFAYTSSTSPIFVPSINFTPRFIKIGHTTFNDKTCNLVATTPKSVTPINPVQIDTTPPSPVTNASAVFDGTTYKLTFDKSPEEDLRDFIITLTGTSPSGSSTRTYILSASEQTQQLLQFTIDENTNFFGSPKNNIVASIVARDLTSNLSTAVENITATLVDSPPTPTGISISPGVLSYIATWNDPNYGLYSYSKIYESSTENGTYTNVANGTSPLTVLTNNGDARWVKISHVSKLGAESTISSATLVDPVNPVEIDITPPENATNLSLSTSADSADPTRTKSSITATWTASTSVDLSGYYLRIRQGTGTWAVHIADRTATSYIFNNLTPNASYTVEIATFDKVSNVTPYGLTQTITTAKDTSAPSAPTSLLLTTLPRQIVATWSAVSDIDIDKYQVQIDTANTFNTANLKTQETYSTTSSFSGLVTGTLYYVRVRGVDKSGNNGAYSSIASATVPAFVSDGVAPSSSPTPTVSSGINAIAVRWSIVSNNDPVTYEVHVSTSSTFTPSASTKVGETESTFMMVSTDGTGAKLLYSTNYYFKIIAKDYDGSASASAASAAVQVSTVGTNDIAANAITAAKIAADTITANEIASNAITANEIQAGSITAVKFNASMGNFTSSMSVGAVSGKQISIVGPAATDPGKIFSANSGALGVFQDANTGFYLDGDGRFSLKDKLSWNGTSLVVQGEIRATSGYFSGALSVNGSGGAMKIGPDAGGSGNNGLYIDANNYWYSTGNFKVGASSSAYLSWNGSLLDIKGQITATSGSFTGNVQLSSGSLYAGTNADSGQRLIINSSGITGYDSSGSNKFNLTTAGLITATSGVIGGWNLANNLLSASQMELFPRSTSSVNISSASWATNVATYTTSAAHNLLLGDYVIISGVANNVYNGLFKVASVPSATTFTVSLTGSGITASSGGTVSANPLIRIGTTNPLYLGQNVGGSNKHGLYIDANDYIYGDGSFSLANGNITWNGTTLSVTGSGSFSGSITASSGSITGSMQIGASGYLYAGASPTSGARVVMTNTGIAGYSSDTGNPSLFLLTPTSSSIAGWVITSGSIEKTAGTSPNLYTIKIDSANSQITAGNSVNIVGMRATTSTGVALWAGTATPSTSSPFYVTNSGVLGAKDMFANGVRLSGGGRTQDVLPDFTGINTINYSIFSDDGKDIILKALSGDPAKIRWIDSSNYQRGTIGWEPSSPNFPNNMVIRAAGALGGNNGLMTLDAGSAGTVNIRANSLTFNGNAIESSTSSVTNRYKNGIYSPSSPNTITYGTGNPPSTGVANGDLHFKY